MHFSSLLSWSNSVWLSNFRLGKPNSIYSWFWKWKMGHIVQGRTKIVTLSPPLQSPSKFLLITHNSCSAILWFVWTPVLFSRHLDTQVVILLFIIRNIYFVLVSAPDTELLKPLAFPVMRAIKVLFTVFMRWLLEGITLGSINILTLLILPIHECCLSFHLTMTSLIFINFL